MVIKDRVSYKPRKLSYYWFFFHILLQYEKFILSLNFQKKVSEKQKYRDRDKERIPSICFTPEMLSTVGAGPGQRQECRIQARRSFVAGIQALELWPPGVLMSRQLESKIEAECH